jgi:acyl-CoA dehydrogenase
VLEEMRAIEEGDVARFDRAFFGHVGHVATVVVRSLGLALSGGRLERNVPSSLVTGRLCQRLARASAAFALVSEATMVTVGGQLKRREKLTGRLADALAWLYLGSAAVKRFHDAGEPEGERPLVEWSLEHALAEIDRALAGVLRNLPSRPAACAVAALVFPLGRRSRGPSDELGKQAALAMLEDGNVRASLTSGIYLPPADEPGLGRLEAALRDALPALAVEAELRHAVSEGRIDHAPGDALAERAVAAGIIDQEDLARLSAADRAREEAIAVDAFDAKDFGGMRR